MSPESQEARLVRLEERHLADRRLLEALAPLSATVAEHGIRLSDMAATLAELKEMARSLDRDCAKASELQEIKDTLERRGLARLQSRGVIVAAVIAAGVALVGVVAQTLVTLFGLVPAFG